MTLDFYHCTGSPPCLAVMLVGDSLGLKFNLIEVDLGKGEHLAPEFIKLNPQHQVPVLNDNGFVMTESRAIMQYLIGSYGKEEHESLYPKDAKKRFLVDRILYFNLGSLYASFADVYYPMILFKTKLDTEKFKKINENLGHLNSFLGTGPYVAGDEVTIGDFDLMASLSCMISVHEDIKNYPNVVAYMDRCGQEGGIKNFKQVSQKIVTDFADWAKPGVQAALAQ